MKIEKIKNRADLESAIKRSGVLLLMFCLGFACQRPSGVKEESEFTKMKKLLEDKWYYADNHDLETELKTNAYRGMLSFEDDPFSLYLTSSNASELTQSLNGSIVGIGVSFTNEGDSLLIVQVIEGSSAADSGLQVGDRILAVDGQPVIEITEDVRSMIQGEQGSSVNLQVEREGQLLSLDVKRSPFSSSVFYNEKEDVLILTLHSFSEDTASTVEAILNEHADGKQKLIIDLRNNGGGYLGAATAIADMLLPSGQSIVKEKVKEGYMKNITATNRDKYNFEKIIILINEMSASASEVLTGALMPLDNCTVIGQKSYGKGTVQELIPFTDNSVIKLTIAEWLTPDEKVIQGQGIEPDRSVEQGILYPVQLLSSNGETLDVDSVSGTIIHAQKILTALGYKSERTDGYYSEQFATVVGEFQKIEGLPITKKLDAETIKRINRRYVQAVQNDPSIFDLQLQEALK